LASWYIARHFWICFFGVNFIMAAYIFRLLPRGSFPLVLMWLVYPLLRFEWDSEETTARRKFFYDRLLKYLQLEDELWVRSSQYSKNLSLANLLDEIRAQKKVDEFRQQIKPSKDKFTRKRRR
jgi:hypothetical protein